MNTNNTQTAPTAHNLENILEKLSQIAGELEEACRAIQAERTPGDAVVVIDVTTEQRIRRCLEKYLTKGNEAVAVAEVVDLVSATVVRDGRPPVPERVIRAVLPKLMPELFDVRMSCSIRYEGKYARGWRGLAPR